MEAPPLLAPKDGAEILPPTPTETDGERDETLGIRPPKERTLMNEGHAVKKAIPVRFVQWQGKYGEPPQVVVPGPGLEHLLPCPGLLASGIIKSIEGDHIIREGDYVMGPGPEGEYWAIKRAIFEATYMVLPSASPAAQKS